LYTYDYENRLTKVEILKSEILNLKSKIKVVSFTYDPFGRRLSKSVHREEIDDDGDDDKDDDDHLFPRTTYYLYDNEDIIKEYNHKGKVTARYVHGLGIDEPLAIEQKGKVYYYHADGLGSVTTLTDSRGKVVQRYDYDSFGNLKRHGHKVKQPYTYTGREWDKETKLYYYRARYYDANIGRFISVDPITRGISHINATSYKQSIKRFPLDKPIKLHQFIYVGNNPVNFIDPWGLWTYATEYGATGTGLTADITGIEGTVDSIFNSVASKDAIVTFTTNVVHGANSLHYSGNAIDLRIRDLSPSQIPQIVNGLRNALGSDYDVILEGDHIHIEYDSHCR
ncbi:MAG: hypothetical protein HY578_10450, partial [Nitrospinae bacterium]|nr:hypothetical protein [Nitrospinota bacterium]